MSPVRSAALRQAVLWNTSGSRIGGALICQSRAGRTISTSCVTNIYRDRELAFEGFTSNSFLFREELVSRVWATRYHFPAIRDGRVKRDVIPDHTTDAAQGWYFNTRREKFKNKRVREAFIDAFDLIFYFASRRN
jgi:ABC-type oligopeptide transport system substrate-binding subunit